MRIDWIARLKTLLSSLMLLASMAVAAPVQADDNDEVVFDPEDVISQVATRETSIEDEWMHRWFQQTLGGFVFEPWGGSAYEADQITLLSYALGFTNVLALFLAIVFIANLYLVGAINTAHQGEVLGQRFSSVWVPIRAATGFLLIMPMQGVGGGVFSFIQVVFVWMLVVSSNLATLLWDNIGELMLQGNPINAVESNITLDPSKQMLEMLVCSEYKLRYRTSRTGWWESFQDFVGMGELNESQYQYGAVQRADESRPDMLSAMSGGTPSNPYPPGDNSGTASLPDAPFSRYVDDPITRISFFNGDCGTIEISQDTLGEEDGMFRVSDGHFMGNEYKLQMREKGTMVVQNQILRQLENLIPIAKAITYGEHTSAPGVLPLGGGQRIWEKISEEFDEGYYESAYLPVMQEYINLGDRYAQETGQLVYEEIAGDEDIGEQWLEDMTRGGWGGAGRWFMEMASFQQMTAEVLRSAEEIEGPDTSPICRRGFLGGNEHCAEFQEDYEQAQDVIAKMMADGMRFLRAQNRMQPAYESNVAFCTSGFDCSTDADPIQGATVGFSRWLVNHFGRHQGVDVTDTTGVVYPFRALSEMGHTMNSYGLGVLTTGSVVYMSAGKISGGAGFFEGRSSALTGVALPASMGGRALENTLTYLLVMLVMLSLQFFTLGVVLAFLVPFMPMFIWVNMIAGYLVNVVEGIVAAPLAVVQLITPEGEGISGQRIERFYALVAMAVLKPSLMIIGLLASVTLGSVIFGVYNMIFWSTADMLLHPSVLNVVALPVLYVLGAYQLVKMIVMIMPKFADSVLNWFSAGVGGGSFGESEVAGTTEQGLGRMQGKMESLASTAGGAHRSASSAAASTNSGQRT